MNNARIVEPHFLQENERLMKHIRKANFLSKARHIKRRRASGFRAQLPLDNNDVTKSHLRTRKNAVLWGCQQRLLIVPVWN